MWLSQGQHLASIGTRTNPAIGLVPKEAGLQLKSSRPARIDYGGKYLSVFLERSSTHTAAGCGWYQGLRESIWFRTQFPGSERTKQVSKVRDACQGF